jgi:uncharacterized repeat protein (TIGR01451 family)
VGALALALGTVAATTVVLSPQAAEAASGTPGTPQAPTTLYSEDFQNASIAGATTIGAYTGASGAKYTADPVYQNTAYCNGLIFGHQATNTALGAANFCGASSSWWPSARTIPQGIGMYNGMADPTQNLAVAEQTVGGGASSYAGTMLQGSGIQMASSGRFVTFSMNVGNLCSVGVQALDRFSLLDGAHAIPLNTADYNVCADATRKTFAVDGQTVTVGTFTGNQATLVTSPTVGFRVDNDQPSGSGNDQAFDNFKILDVTPQLDKTFTPAIAPTGGVSTLTFTVTNTSELAAKNGWSFTDALPAGLTVASSPAVETTCPSGVVTAAAGSSSVAVTGNLAAGMASCTVSVNVTSPVVASFTNGPENVTETGLNPPGSATVTFESPALSLTKNAAAPVDVNHNGITDVGDTIQYTFDVKNTGDVPITNVKVTDPKAGPVTCPSTTLAVGASETCSADNTYEITEADATHGSVDNTATATGTSPSGATVTKDSSKSTPATVAAPALTVVKSADPSDADSYLPGQVITYNFTVTNTGNVTMNDVGVADDPFTGTGTAPEPTCPSTTLDPGDQEVCTATYTLTAQDVDNGSVTNTATANGTPQGSNTSVPSSPSSVTIPELPAPGITVVKSANPTTVTKAGQTVTYSFVVTNTGNVTLTGVAVRDISFSGTGDLPNVDCPTTTLVAGQVETCTTTYTVNQDDVNAGSLTNQAVVDATPPDGVPLDPVPSNPTNVDIPASPALSIVKTADVQAAAVGEKITYTFTVTNTGNVTITAPQVSDTGFTGTGPVPNPVCPVGPIQLNPDQVETCTATYTVTQADVDAGSISNAATVTGTPMRGDLPPANSPDVVVPTNPHAALSLVKTASSQQVTQIGQVVTYTFAVTNTGNVTIKDPSVKEGTFTGHGTLSPVKCPSGNTLAPGEEIDCTATYTVVAADLASNGTLSNTATVTGSTTGGDLVSSDPSTSKVTEVGLPAPMAGLASTGSDTWTAGLVGLGMLILGLLAASAAWLQRRNRLS